MLFPCNGNDNNNNLQIKKNMKCCTLIWILNIIIPGVYFSLIFSGFNSTTILTLQWI